MLSSLQEAELSFYTVVIAQSSYNQLPQTQWLRWQKFILF